MADKIVQLKDKDDNNIYPLSHIMDDYILWNEREGGDIGEYILWEEDTGGTTSPLEYAPVESTFVSNEDDPSVSFINPNNAIFNFKTSNNQLRARDQRQFLVTFTNPIDGYNFYGTCETTEIVNFYGSGGNVEIWQVATDVTTNNTAFKRKGEIASVVDVTNLTSQSITWGSWYPVEHPGDITSQITDQNGATWYASTFKVYKMGPMVWFTGNLQKVNASISADSNVVIGTGFPRPIDSEFYLLGGTSNADARKFAFRIKSDGSLTISSADNVTTTANTSIWQLVSGMYLTKD